MTRPRNTNVPNAGASPGPLAGVRIDTEPGTPPAALLHVKAVPGAKQDQIAGALGERLKVRVSAPPEGGKANRAIAALLAEQLGVRASDVAIARGQSNAEKVVRVRGLSADEVRARLSADPPP